MHPLVVVVTLFLFILFVAAGNWLTLVSASIVLWVAWVLLDYRPGRNTLRMIKRLKWLLLALLITYGWFTPGTAVFSDLSFSPTGEGLLLATHRIAMLVLIVLAVDTLLSKIPEEEFLCGLYLFLSPIEWLGIDRQRFVLRAVMTLRAASQGMQNRNGIMAANDRGILARVYGMSSALSRQFNQAVSTNETNTPVVITLPDSPTWQDWRWVFVMCVILGASFLQDLL